MRTFLLSTLLCLALSPVSADDGPLRQAIDADLATAWKREKVTVAKPATDAEFLRRVTLDLIGTIPTYEETVAFLASTDANKRDAVIDRLLADARFAQHQADLWDLILFSRNPPGYDTDKRDGFQAWMRRQFEQNVPYDVWTRELLRAEGNSVENGAMYFVQYRNQPEDATEAVTQTFLGVQLQCARCHDHPYETWSQLDFYGFAAFLSRLEVVTVGKKDNLTMYAIGERNSGDIQFTGPAKNQMPGKKGEPVKPKFLHGDKLDEPALPDGYKEVKFEQNKVPPKPTFSRKDQLADWITKADNPFFARAIVNRVWAQYFGRGIVHPVDNMSPSNSPSHPELLTKLAAALIDHKFDLKWLIRELVSTQAYQLSASGSGEALPQWFQHARMRPLSAEELTDAWRVATWFAAAEQSGGSGKKTGRFRPLEGGYMLRFFGTPNTGTGDFQGGLQEHLYLNNGPMGSVISFGKGSLADYVADTKIPVDERIERLYLSTLNRRPAAEEREKIAAFLNDKNSPSDAIWTLITSSEFRFNH